MSDKSEYDPTYFKTRTFIANTRSHLNNLKTYYGVDLLYEDHNAHKFLSHIIFSKFSLELKQAFIWELKSEYPTFAEILANYCKVTNQLANFKTEKAERNSNKFKPNRKNNSGFNFNTQIRKFKIHCRFCQVDGHTSNDCTIYATYQQRINRCGVKKLCVQCTSPDHISGPYCPASKKGPGGLYQVCKYCTKFVNIAKKSAVPVQNNVCLSTNTGQKSKFLLPILSITFKGRSGCYYF